MFKMFKKTISGLGRATLQKELPARNCYFSKRKCSHTRIPKRSKGSFYVSKIVHRKQDLFVFFSDAGAAQKDFKHHSWGKTVC